jgi:23S rRNA (adenine2503-C2)-methyltransferase
MPPIQHNSDALSGLFPEEISLKIGAPLMRGRQIFNWLQKKQTFDMRAMTNIPKEDQCRIEKEYSVISLDPVIWQESPKTGTSKVLFNLFDGETVESVLLSQERHITFCLSSQAGCAIKCSFCATGQAGFRRNLSPSEIMEQALHLMRRIHSPIPGTPNIVFMGMGEPFHNYDAVIKAIQLLMHPAGMGIGARKITVSTAGDIEGILRFAEEPWQVRLSVSLHAANDDLRSELVPLNRRYPLAPLYEALTVYQKKRNRQITIEWVLMDKVNDSLAQAKELSIYLKGLDAVVNLIPWNSAPGLPYHPSSLKHQERFAQALESAGVKATLRKERGDDIDAACGQLRNIRPILS